MFLLLDVTNNTFKKGKLVHGGRARISENCHATWGATISLICVTAPIISTLAVLSINLEVNQFASGASPPYPEE